MKATILSICDYTGNWSRPYADAAYQVIRIDLQNGQDVRLMHHVGEPIHGILAAPPCTHFSRAGASHWKNKGDAELLEGMSVVDACLRMVAIYRPTWWVLENPIGRLQDYIGPPQWKFDPWQFGDPYTKRTWLWGHFTPPLPLFSTQARCEVEPEFRMVSAGSMTRAQLRERGITKQLPRDRTAWLGSRRKAERSATPHGFSKAFFEANP